MQANDVRRIAVVGAGLMGHGIALEFALAGYDVRLHDRTDELLARATGTIRSSLSLLQGHGLTTSEAAADAASRIRMGTRLDDLVADADVVIEAATEHLEIKLAIFGELDRLCPPRTILASNSSSFMPSKVAAATKRADRVLVAHYFNPPYLVPLVELVRSSATSDDTVDGMHALLVGIGKKPTVVRGEVPGFIGNRLQAALYREALSLVQDGVASAQDVDAVIRYGFGRRLAAAGEIEIFDLAGLDTILTALGEIMPDLYSQPEPPRILREKVAQGRLGAKSGAGFYEWTPDSAADARARIARALVEMNRWDKS
jgi:3-hydroxybutyryl-CoA dehydrogenase